MNPYKVWLLNSDNKPEKVIIFNGDNIHDFSVFTDEEFEWVDSDNTIVSRATIHNDDSVSQVKYKIMKEIQCEFGDLYMFCYKKHTFNILEAMPKGDPMLLGQFIKNIDLDGINVKTCINSLPLFDAECTLSIKTSLGMQPQNNRFLFSANPFHMDFDLDTNLVYNDKILLGNDIEDNNIYICVAKDVLEFAKNRGFDTNLVSRMYFPSNHDATKSQGIEEAETDTIDHLYAIYNNRMSDFVATKGIQKFTIEFDTKSPQALNKIFRDIHCDAEFPFVQYNRGIGAESVYRLYGVSLTRFGKRIPVLGKEKIAELSQMTEEKQIHIYNMVYNLSVTVDEAGVLRATFEQPDNDTKTVGEIETILKIVLNPLFAKYCNYQFKTFADARAIRINYVYSTALLNSLRLQNKFVQAVYGSDMRYKRVHNYGKLDKFNTFLSDLVKTRGIDDTIVELVTSHAFSKEDAIRAVQEFLEMGVFAGFPSSMTKDGNMLVVRVYGLDCIDYIENLNIYNDSIARLMQSGSIQEQTVGSTHGMINTTLNNLFDRMNQDTAEEEEDDDNDDEKEIGFSDDENDKDNDKDKDLVHHISLENNFYTLYRSLILSLIQNRENQKQILDILDKPNRKELLSTFVKQIAEPVVVFSKISKKVLDTISSDDVFRKDRQIMIPRRNLITEEENRTLYSKKVAEEIIKSDLIQKLSSVDDVLPELTLNTNEYIVLESLLFSDNYFSDMVVSKDNECLTMVPVTESRDLPMLVGTTRLEFKATAECSFGPLVYMLYELKKVVYPLSSVKSMLWKAYQAEFEGGDKLSIISRLKQQGKAELIDTKIYDDELEELIKSEGYFMTTLDVSVFAKAYKIPVVLFSTNRNPNEEKMIKLGVDADKYFFVDSVPSSRGIPKNVLINQILTIEF